MALKIDIKFEGELTCASKNYMRNLWQIFNRALESLIIRTLMASFYLKLKMYELKIYRGVMSWQWRMMQKLKRNLLFVQNWHEECNNVLTQTLENLTNLHFNGLLLTKVYNVWAKKSTEELCLMAQKADAKFEGRLTCAF